MAGFYNDDQSIADAAYRLTPEYHEARKYAADLGYDIETGNKITPPPMEEQMTAWQMRQVRSIAQVTQEPEDELPEQWIDQEQPGANMEGWRGWVRGGVNSIAKVAGRTAQHVSDIVLPERAAKSVGGGVEAVTRGIISQAPAAIAEIPGDIIKSLDLLEEVVDDLVLKGFDVLGAGERIREVRAADEERAKLDQVVDLDSPGGKLAKLLTPDALEGKSAADALDWLHGKVFTDPQTEGERAWRDVLSIVAGTKGVMKATKLQGGTKFANFVGNMTAGAIGDFVFVDPTHDKTIEMILGAVSPEMKQDYLDYITGGDVDENNFRRSLTARLANAGVGAVGASIIDGAVAAGKWLKGANYAAQAAKTVGDTKATSQLLDEMEQFYRSGGDVELADALAAAKGQSEEVQRAAMFQANQRFYAEPGGVVDDATVTRPGPGQADTGADTVTRPGPAQAQAAQAAEAAPEAAIPAAPKRTTLTPEEVAYNRARKRVHTEQQLSDEMNAHAGKLSDIPKDRVIGHEKMAQIYAELGADPEFIRRIAQDNQFLERQVMGAVQMANQKMDDAKLLAAAYRQTRNADDAQAMMDAIAEAGTALNFYSLTGSAVGRSLNLFKMGEASVASAVKQGLRKGDLAIDAIGKMKDFDDISAMLVNMELKDAVKLANMVQEPTLKGMIREVFYFNQLSGMGTHGRNVQGNLFLSGINVAEAYMRAGLNKAGVSHGGATLDDANNVAKGYFVGFANAIQAAKKRAQGAPSQFGIHQGVFDEGRQKVTEQYLHRWLQQKGISPDSQYFRAASLFGKMVGLPGDLLEVSDEFFKNWHYGAEVYAAAARENVNMFDDAAFEAWKLGPGKGALSAATQKARVLTLTNELTSSDQQGFVALGNLANKFNNMKADSLVMMSLMPFIRTATNMARFGLDATPGVAYLSKVNREAFQAGGAAHEAVLARQAVGGMVAGMAAFGAVTGAITGNGPVDPEQREQWLRVNTPNSVKVPGFGDVGFDPNGPLGIIINTAATVAEFQGQIEDPEGVEALDRLALGVQEYIAQLEKSLPFVQPFSDILSAVAIGKFGQNQDPEAVQKALVKSTGDTAWKFVEPRLSAEVRRIFDPVQKDLRDLSDYVKTFVPGYGTAPMRRDIWGNPRYTAFGMKPGALANGIKFFFGNTVGPENLSPVDQELVRLQYGAKIRSEYQGVELTRQQQSDLAAKAGPLAYAEVSAAIMDPEWVTLTDVEKRDYLSSIVRGFYEAGAAEMFEGDDDFQREVRKSLEFRHGGTAQ